MTWGGNPGEKKDFIVLHCREVARKSAATFPTLPIPGRPQMHMKPDWIINMRLACCYNLLSPTYLIAGKSL